MISLSEKGRITELQGNILTSSQQSVLNWTPAGTGNVDLSYANEVNHFRFGGITASQIIYKVTHEVGWQNVSMNDDATNRAKVNQIITAWQTSGKDLIVARVYFGDTRDYDVSFFVPTDDNYSSDSYSVTMTNGTIYRLSSYGSGSDWHSDKITTSQATYSSTNSLIQFGKADDYESVDNSYTLSFNAGDKLASKQQLIDYINNTEFDGMTMQLLDYSALWECYGANTVYAFWKANSYFYFVATDETCNGIKFRQGTGSLSDRFYYDPYSGNSGHCEVVLYNISGHTIESIYIGAGEQVIPSTGTFVKNIDSELYNVSQNTNTYYLFSLSTRSTTGFTKDSSAHNITLTNGNNTYILEVNSNASQEYHQQGILFTPTSASCSLKLDLSGMQGSGVELDIKNIGVYEIGGEE